jgi:hypothetical protein
LCDESGGREDKYPTKQGDGNDRHNERSRGPHRTPENQGRKLGEPGFLLVSPTPNFNSRKNDSPIEVRRSRRFWQCRQQPDQPGRRPQLGRAGGTAAEVLGQEAAAGRSQLIELVRVDQRACGVAIQGLVRVDTAHKLYMTRPSPKVAVRCASEGSAPG